MGLPVWSNNSLRLRKKKKKTHLEGPATMQLAIHSVELTSQTSIETNDSNIIAEAISQVYSWQVAGVWVGEKSIWTAEGLVAMWELLSLYHLDIPKRKGVNKHSSRKLPFETFIFFYCEV